MLTIDGRKGFTLVEISVAASLLVIVIAIAMFGFGHVLRETNLNQAQNELDTQVQVAMEGLKYRLRLSGLDQMVFFPDGAGPYTAVSFPMAEDLNGDGAVDTDVDGKIVWTKTLVYHVWSSAPEQLRLTTFSPRIALDGTQRRQQLASVVVTGNGSATHNSTSATTKVIFENLFDWQITPRGSTYDGYESDLTRDAGWVLGSVVLTGGMHTLSFTVVGTNSASSGLNVGLDVLFMSPSYSEREGEFQWVTDQSGAQPTNRFISGGSWSGNYDLWFPAASTGDYFTLTMENDRWEESNFHRAGYEEDNTTVVFDDSLDPRSSVVRLDGRGFAWYAHEQTGATNASGDPLVDGLPDIDGSVQGGVVRVLIRGSEMESGDWIKYDDGNVWVSMQSGGGDLDPGTGPHLDVHRRMREHDEHDPRRSGGNAAATGAMAGRRRRVLDPGESDDFDLPHGRFLYRQVSQLPDHVLGIRPHALWTRPVLAGDDRYPRPRVLHDPSG
ncbi:Tfp pilus assembly protein FimT/FimU [Verrucomicrobiota bacterium]